ncbi:hypothetical protein [Paraburkholderia sp. UCT70]|uniref:hypothetical protein n=1 Tax=Paraburkholderia sp. UCT70 TaxID=2991068 RepID=UPI003D1AF2A8
MRKAIESAKPDALAAVRATFEATVPLSAWKSWLRIVRAGGDEAITAPPDQAAMPAVLKLAASSVPLDLPTRLAAMDANVAMLVSFCVTQVPDPKTGEITLKCKNPVLLEKAIRVQALASKLSLDHAEKVLELERLRDQMKELGEALGEALNLEAPDVTDRVLRKLHAAAQAQRDRLAGIAPETR